MKKCLNHSFARLWAFVLTFALLLSGCGTGTGATQGTGGSQEPAGKDAGEGWKPTTSVNLIVPYAAGGGTDIMGRAIAQYIDLDGQTMHITNIEGGSGTVGAMEAYHADNDGLTLLLHGVTSSAFAYAEGTLPENLCEEMIWVACLVEDPFVISVASDSPYESTEDLIAAAKAAPGSLTVAGTGTSSSRATLQGIGRAIASEFNYIPYDSAAKSRAAVLGGHEDALLCTLSEAKASADSGELRILTLMSEERSELVPDVPTFKELGYDDIAIPSYRSVALPSDTDEEIARYYEGKLKEVFENGEFQSAMRTLGYNTAFTGMDDMWDIINKNLKLAEEYVLPAAE